ncbi:MAG: carboxypeptidase-like regulatory domain-containing protein [Nitrospirota bacterium]
MRKLIFLLALSMLFVSSVGCANEQGPWHGKVIDAETKQPIEGAVVVAIFKKSSFALGSGPVDSFADTKEVLTDKNGEFMIPVLREPSPPVFTIFKPGYGSFPQYQVSPTGELPRDLFQKKGTIVELPKLTDKNKRLLSVNAARFWFYPEKMPKLTELTEAEYRNLGLR